jgi:DNA polymerase III alpha subunit (gram-positive type)
VARVLVIDLETTGFDPKTCDITEVGLVLWDTERRKPLVCESHYAKVGVPLPVEIIEITGIWDDDLTEFGLAPGSLLEHIENKIKALHPAYLVGHNINMFDRPFLLEQFYKHGVPCEYTRGLPVLDTRTDLPFKAEPDSRKLKHLAAEHGFLNPFSHRALFDAMATAKLMDFYPFDEIVALSRIPLVVVRAIVSYDQRDLAKAQKYMWEKLGDLSFPKCWVKLVRENQLEKEIATCKAAGFQSVRIK